MRSRGEEDRRRRGEEEERKGEKEREKLLMQACCGSRSGSSFLGCVTVGFWDRSPTYGGLAFWPTTGPSLSVCGPSV